MADVDRLFRVRRTCHEMLTARGYLVSADELEMSKDDFRSKFGAEPRREDLAILVPKQDDPADQIFVFFPDDPKVGVKTIKIFAERMKENGVGRAIMVAQASLTPFAKQCLEELRPKYNMEVFGEAELLINITKHHLVPEHQILDDNEKQVLLDRYKVKETQLPRIQFNDPVARFFGMRRGQVVRIVRSSETAGRYVTYRLCV